MKNVIALAVVLGLAACGPMPEDTSGAKAPSGPPVQVDSKVLGKAFKENEVSAKAKYDGHVLEVSGVIQTIELDFMDAPVVSLPGTDDFSNVQASFPKEAAAQTGALKKGQKITVSCNKVSEVMGTPMLSECTLK